MKKISLIFIIIWAMTFPFSSSEKSYSQPLKPKLDCNKMVSELIKAIEDRDIKKICPLIGREYDEYEENSLNERIDVLYTRWPSFVEELHLFPEIGELPEWITEVRFEFEYIEGNYRLELRPKFELEDDTWIMEAIDLDLHWHRLEWTDRRSMSRGEISFPPPEGKKTLDAGLNEIMKKFVSDFTQKNWDSIKQYAPVFKDPKRMSELEKMGKEFGELLSQFPSIGPIPAPAVRVIVELEGTAEGKDIDIEVEFEWEENNTLVIDAISVEY